MSGQTCVEEQLWGIAEIADYFGITPRAIRFYETKGLISPKRHNGQRVFNAADKQRLERILRAKRTGFSLDDINHFLEVVDGKVTARDALLQRKSDFERVIGNLRRKRSDIDILADDMKLMCVKIDEHIKTAPKSQIFEFAEDYQSALLQSLDDGFIPV